MGISTSTDANFGPKGGAFDLTGDEEGHLIMPIATPCAINVNLNISVHLPSWDSKTVRNIMIQVILDK